MISIAVLTATRAEYGLMKQLLFKLRDDPDFDLRLLVTGTHLSEKFGHTIDEIISDNIPIAARFDILTEKNGMVDASLTMSEAISLFSDYFSDNKPNLLFVDGDRYEALAVCIAAVNNCIPIAHCGGGAVTKGANDDYWRNCITKLSFLHFATSQKCRDRIIQMGEDPDRVFLCGSPGIENIRVMKLGSKNDLEERLGFKLDRPYAIATFHPVTLEQSSTIDQLNAFLNACDQKNEISFIFTMANADTGGDIINKLLRDYCNARSNRAVCLPSMGSYYYLTAMKHCEFVIGNSSSGLIEAPSFKIPTINIGNRQEGRERADSVIDCKPEKDDIIKAMELALRKDFREKCQTVVNPFGDGHSSDIIIKTIKNFVFSKKLSMKKGFYEYQEN